jgi:heterodisulfide reductase subunit B
MCHGNLDTRQADISAETGTAYAVPILYVTELMALALGVPNVRGWLEKHLVPAVEAVSAKGLI